MPTHVRGGEKERMAKYFGRPHVYPYHTHTRKLTCVSLGEDPHAPQPALVLRCSTPTLPPSCTVDTVAAASTAACCHPTRTSSSHSARSRRSASLSAYALCGDHHAGMSSAPQDTTAHRCGSRRRSASAPSHPPAPRVPSPVRCDGPARRSTGRAPPPREGHRLNCVRDRPRCPVALVVRPLRETWSSWEPSRTAVAVKKRRRMPRKVVRGCGPSLTPPPQR